SFPSAASHRRPSTFTRRSVSGPTIRSSPNVSSSRARVFNSAETLRQYATGSSSGRTWHAPYTKSSYAGGDMSASCACASVGKRPPTHFACPESIRSQNRVVSARERAGVAIRPDRHHGVDLLHLEAFDLRHEDQLVVVRLLDGDHVEPF